MLVNQSLMNQMICQNLYKFKQNFKKWRLKLFGERPKIIKSILLKN